MLFNYIPALTNISQPTIARKIPINTMTNFFNSRIKLIFFPPYK